MRVGIYIDRMDLKGGAQRVVSNLCHGWSRRGWHVTLIVASGEGQAFDLPPSVERRVLAGAHKRRGLLGAWDNVWHVLRLRRAVREARLDAVLAVSVVANVQLALASPSRRVVKVGSEHDVPGFLRLPFHKEIFRRILYPRLDAVVCPTQAAARHIARTYPGTRTLGVPNWLTWPLPASSGETGAASLRRPGRKLFLACGRLDKMKGFRELIANFAALKDRLPEWDLAIVGEGEDRPALESLVAAHGLAGRVSLPGWAADVASLFRSADLFVFPSYSEGFALVLAEAMACGLPCLSYDCPVGPAEIIRHGHDGVLVPDRDQEAFRSAMLRLASDESERRRLAQSCPEVLGRFSEEAIQPLWEQVLRTKR